MSVRARDGSGCDGAAWLQIAIACLLLPTVSMAGSAQDSTATVPVPQAIEPVVVTADRNTAHWVRGFYQRRTRGTGTFLTREEIASYDMSRMTDLLRSRVAGVQVRGRSSVRLRGQRCAPMVWLDGTSTPAGEFDLDMITPSSVAALEVYPSGANAPPEFRTSFGRDGCGGVIVVWSRVGLEAGETPDDLVITIDGSPVPVYRAEEVDEGARIDSTQTVTPMYPDSLYAFAIAGSVSASVVVDTTGEPVNGTIEITSATSPAFGDAVRHAIRASRFHPARKRGVPVRQLLVMQFNFKPERR